METQERPIEILQIGSGNFLRGFVDWMIGRSNDAGLTNTGVAMAYATNRPGRKDPVKDQAGRYHVVLEGVRNGEAVRSVEEVNLIDQIIDPFADWASIENLVCSHDLKVIISNTTEAGITYRPMSLDETPDSFPATLARLLYARFQADGEGLAVVPCELIEDNGQKLLELVIRHAKEAGWSSSFLTWLDESCHFYDTLVDRIVAGYPDDAAAIHEEIGEADHALVKGEYFSLWVIGGDDYLRTVLPLDQLDVGVKFLEKDHLAPFREKKVRILNGSHTALAQLGLLSGKETVREAFTDPQLRRYIETMVSEEVLPTIDEDDAELRQFAASILERFDNPYLKHRLADIELNSIAKWKSRNLPVLRDCWESGKEAPKTAFILAALLALYSGQVAHDFQPRDEPGAVEFIRQTFVADELPVWVEGVISKFGLASELSDADAKKLIDVTAENVQCIISLGIRKAIATMLTADGDINHENG